MKPTTEELTQMSSYTRLSHRLTCRTCSAELGVDEGEMRPEAVDLFKAAHADHEIAEERC